MGNKSIILIYAGIAIFLGLSLFNNVKLFFKARSTVASAQAELAREEAKNAELKKKENELSKTLYIERVARDTLGLGKEGELVLVLPSEEELKKMSPRLFAKKEEELLQKELPVWRQWLQLFI